MTRLASGAALGALLAVVVLAAFLLARPAELTSVGQADALARELRCPDCQGLSVADSPTQSAEEIRRQIDELLAGGASPQEVRAHFVDRYGEWILLAPSSAILWLVPLVVVGLGAVVVFVWLKVAQRRPPKGWPSVTEPARRRVHEEADALDA